MASDGLGEDGRSPLTAQALGAMWPDVRSRLRRSLLRTGAGVDAVDEALAEAATRALSRRLPVASPDDFCRWAFVVARNNKSASDPAGTGAQYTPWADVNGSGDISTADVAAVKARLNDDVPEAAPAAPAPSSTLASTSITRDLFSSTAIL